MEDLYKFMIKYFIDNINYNDTVFIVKCATFSLFSVLGVIEGVRFLNSVAVPDLILLFYNFIVEEKQADILNSLTNSIVLKEGGIPKEKYLLSENLEIIKKGFIEYKLKNSFTRKTTNKDIFIIFIFENLDIYIIEKSQEFVEFLKKINLNFTHSTGVEGSSLSFHTKPVSSFSKESPQLKLSLLDIQQVHFLIKKHLIWDFNNNRGTPDINELKYMNWFIDMLYEVINAPFLEEGVYIPLMDEFNYRTKEESLLGSVKYIDGKKPYFFK